MKVHLAEHVNVVAHLCVLYLLCCVFHLVLCQHDDEGRTITAEFEKYFVVVTYVPNAGQKLERLSYRTTEWDQALLAFLQELQKKKPVR